MAQILIRNLPDDVMQRLRTKAELAGASLEQTVRNMIVAHSPLSPEEKLAFLRSIREGQGGPYEPLSKDDYREGLL
jgi:plasmid stability protein